MDVILYNGNIVTVDKDNPRIEAVAVKGNRIRCVGKSEEILALKNPDTQIVDLEGKTVVPGFNDSHMHLLSYGLSLERVNLNGCRSIEEMLDRVRAFIKEKNIPEGEWVQGRGWNQSLFKEKRLPSREDLDRVSKAHPIVLTRTCGHLCVVNTRALQIARIFDNPPEVEGGGIDKDEKGAPRGILREMAMTLVYKKIPPLRKEEIKAILVKAANNCIKEGLTSVQSDDFEAIKGDFREVLNAYLELDDAGRLPIRVNEQVQLPTLKKLETFLKLGYKTGDGSRFFKIGPLKLLSDGSLGGRTAALSEPYEDETTTAGILIFTPDELYALVEKAHTNGLQVAVHAIGDRAMEMVLETYRKVMEKHPKKDPRFRVIHCQITTEEIIDKFKEYDVIADIQPIFVASDLSIVESRVGEERAKWTYNWKTLLEKGARVSAGSDCPVEPFNPLFGIYAAVTRKNLEGYPEGGWLPDQKLSVEEALYIYTMGSAYCTFEENIKGSITPGKLADMVVLSEDIFNIEPDYIKDVKVEKTIIDGKVMYEKE